MINNRIYMLVMVLGLAACDMHAPTYINQTKIQVRDENFHRDMTIAQANEDGLAGFAQEFIRNSGTDLRVVVTYDPQSYRNTAMMAGDNAVKISKALRAQGIADVQTQVLPVNHQGDIGRVMISYRAMSAHAPDGCTDMPGMNGNLIESDPNYKLGCGVNTLIARQVARPSDLLGREENPALLSDGRGAANIVDVYRTGAPNKPLEGQQASDKD